MKTRVYHVTLSVEFDIDATSREVAKERAMLEGLDWLKVADVFTIEEIKEAQA